MGVCVGVNGVLESIFVGNFHPEPNHLTRQVVCFTGTRICLSLLLLPNKQLVLVVVTPLNHALVAASRTLIGPNHWCSGHNQIA